MNCTFTIIFSFLSYYFVCIVCLSCPPQGHVLFTQPSAQSYSAVKNIQEDDKTRKLTCKIICKGVKRSYALRAQNFANPDHPAIEILPAPSIRSTFENQLDPGCFYSMLYPSMIRYLVQVFMLPNTVGHQCGIVLR